MEEENVEKIEKKEEKTLAMKIQEKLDERILKILDKETLTVEEYILLERKISEMQAEKDKQKLYGTMMNTLFR